MRKIMIMLTALLFGVVLQAQEFDFSCEDLPNFGAVKIKVKIASDDVAPLGVVDLEKYENPPNVLVDATTISLEDGYEVGSKIFYEPYENYPGVPGLQYYFNTKEVGATNVRVSVRAQSTFDFTQDDFTMDLSGVLSDTFASVPVNEGSVGIGVIIGSNDVVEIGQLLYVEFEHDGSKLGKYSYDLATGYEVVQNIAYENHIDHPTIPNLQYYFNTKPVESTSVGINILLLPGFDYTQDDFDVDLTEFFAEKIALVNIPNVDPGDLEDFIGTTTGDADEVPEDASIKFGLKVKVTEAWGKNYYFKPNADNLVYVSGSSNIHHFTGTFRDGQNDSKQLNAQTGSDWETYYGDETISGGEYDNYTQVYENDDTYDMFLQWDNGESDYQLIIITHSGFDYNGSNKTAGDSYDGYAENLYGSNQKFFDLRKFGNLGDLLQPYNKGNSFDPNGSTVKSSAQRDIRIIAKEDSSGTPNAQGPIILMNGNQQTDTYGNAKIFKRSTITVYIDPHNSSSDANLDPFRIKRGKYKDYVRVYGATSHDTFMKWNEGSNSIQVLFIAHRYFNFLSNDIVKVEADLWSGW